MTNKNILIQGWRGINHSYAMVNQYQILELLKYNNLNLFHEDLPYIGSDWSGTKNNSGFAPAERKKIESITKYESEVVDATYRISFPYRFYGGCSEKIYCFGTSELQTIDDSCIYDGAEKYEKYSNDKINIITPSNWSKIGFLNYGFNEDDISVIPHGIDPSVFYPSSDEDKVETRKLLKLSKESFIFLNVGSMTGNKGIDKLILAFSAVWKKHPSSILLLKDQSDLFGTTALDVVARVKKQYPNKVKDEVLANIKVLSNNLKLEELRMLYGACNAYVSPYRAEGFNLTPLEAAACGTPIIITDGGSTDDYYHPSFALKISGKKHSYGKNNYIEPSLESLIHCMNKIIEGKATQLNPALGISWITKNFSWKIVTAQLVSLM